MRLYNKKVAVVRIEKQIAVLKKTFGIETHYLETLLAEEKAEEVN